MLLLWMSLICVGWTSCWPIPRPEQQLYTNETSNFHHHYCVVDEKVYQAGESFPSPTACHQCVCQPPDIRCEHVHCEKKMGCRAIQMSGQCCPQYQCECESNGRVYSNGEKLETTDSPCKVCYCRGGVIMCGLIQCYTRDDCKPQQVPGRCCPKYDHCPPLDNQLNSMRSTAWSSPTASSFSPEPTITHRSDNSISETSVSNRFELLGEASESNPFASIFPHSQAAMLTTPAQDPSYGVDSDWSASENVQTFQQTTLETPGSDDTDSSLSDTQKVTEKKSESTPTSLQISEQEENEQSLSGTTDVIDNVHENNTAASEKRIHIQTIPTKVKEDTLVTTANSVLHKDDTTVATTEYPSTNTQESTTSKDYDKVTFIPYESNMTKSANDGVTERMQVEPEAQTAVTVTADENTSQEVAQVKHSEEDDAVQSGVEKRMEIDKIGETTMTTEVQTTPLPSSSQDIPASVEKGLPVSGPQPEGPLETSTGEAEGTERAVTLASIETSPLQKLPSSQEDVALVGEDSWEHNRPTQMVTDEIHYITTTPSVKEENHTQHLLEMGDKTQLQPKEEMQPQNVNNSESSNRYDKLGETEASQPVEKETTPSQVPTTVNLHETTEVSEGVTFNNMNTTSITESAIPSEANGDYEDTTRYLELGEEGVDGDTSMNENPTATPKQDELPMITREANKEQNEEVYYKTIDRSDDESSFDEVPITTEVLNSEIHYSFQSDEPSPLDESTVSSDVITTTDIVPESELENQSELPSVEESTVHKDMDTPDIATTPNMNETPVEANTEKILTKGRPSDEYFSSDSPEPSFLKPALTNEQEFDSPPIIKLSEEMANHQMVVEIHHITPAIESTESLEDEGLVLIHDVDKEFHKKKEHAQLGTDVTTSLSSEESNITNTNVSPDNANPDLVTDDVLKEYVIHTRSKENNVTNLLHETQGTFPTVQEQTETEDTLTKTITIAAELFNTEATKLHTDLTEEKLTTIEEINSRDTNKKETINKVENGSSPMEETQNESGLLIKDGATEVEDSEENPTVTASGQTYDVSVDVELTTPYGPEQLLSDETTLGGGVTQTPNEVTFDDVSVVTQDNLKPDLIKDTPSTTLVVEIATEKNESSTSAPQKLSDAINNITEKTSVKVNLRTETTDEEGSRNTTEASMLSNHSGTSKTTKNLDVNGVTNKTLQDGIIEEVETSTMTTSNAEINPPTVRPDSSSNDSILLKETIFSEYSPIMNISINTVTRADDLSYSNTSEISTSPVAVTLAVKATHVEGTVTTDKVSQNIADNSNVTEPSAFESSEVDSGNLNNCYASTSGDEEAVTAHISPIETSTETILSKTNTGHKGTSYITDDYQYVRLINDLPSTVSLYETTKIPESTGSYSPTQENMITDSNLTSALPGEVSDDLESVLQFQANKTKIINTTWVDPDIEDHLTFQSNRTTVKGGGWTGTTGSPVDTGDDMGKDNLETTMNSREQMGTTSSPIASQGDNTWLQGDSMGKDNLETTVNGDRWAVITGNPFASEGANMQLQGADLGKGTIVKGGGHTETTGNPIASEVDNTQLQGDNIGNDKLETTVNDGGQTETAGNPIASEDVFTQLQEEGSEDLGMGTIVKGGGRTVTTGNPIASADVFTRLQGESIEDLGKGTTVDGRERTVMTGGPIASEDVFTRLQREDIEELGKDDIERLQNFFKHLYVEDDHETDLAGGF